MIEATTVPRPGIDMKTETLIGMREGHRLPVPVTERTIYRWIQRGIRNKKNGRRVFLETVPYGGRIFTSLEAVDRFNAKLAEG